MTRRTSLAPTMADKTEDRRRRRTADARLEPFTEHPSSLTSAPSSEIGSSAATPLIICSDDDTDDTAHRRSRSDKKDSKKTPVRKPEVQSAGTSGRLENVTIHGSTVSEGCAHRSAGSEGDASPSPRPPKSSSYCGKPYLKLGCMRNHQERCDKCKAAQEKDKETTGGAQEIPEGSAASDTGEALPSSVLRIPGGKDDRRNDDRTETETYHSREEEILDNNDTTTQMVSLNLRTAASNRLAAKEGEGYLYIYRDTKGGLLKIGYSNNPRRRGQQHKKCGPNLLNIYISNRITSMKRAEQLVKLDLSHACRPWHCDACGHTHKEYFEVDEERAKTIVDRWADWINKCKPYGEDGDLLPIWSHLLHFDRVAASEIGPHDHEARWVHWKWVLSAPSADDFARFAPPSLPIPPSNNGRSSERAATGPYDDSGKMDRSSQPLARRNKGQSDDASILTLLGPVKQIAVDRKSRTRYSMTFEVECRVRQVSERDSVDRSSQ